MESSKELKDRERIAKQIAKTSDSIRKKYRALKTGKIKEDIPIKKEINIAKDKIIKKWKPKYNENNEDDDDDDDDDRFWIKHDFN
ncbi:hypothetical protein ALC56_03910 [Trachymyrmex septentrionalis]|uniref:Uncharacterized protein n=1 Tax=Trachymyrmex septentrionalis TaxID=34720 RepID=A0A151JZ79_9HYME|nr:hypothetical protein ALC56_03910 [Trachymyrmex septentrionalis]